MIAHSSSPTETMETTKKATRKPNWSQDQLLLLAQLVLEFRHTIKGKFGSGVTSKAKRDAWESISFNINAAFPAVSRSANDCEKGWYSLQSHSRAEIAAYKQAIKKTGQNYLLFYNAIYKSQIQNNLYVYSLVLSKVLF